MTEKNGALTKEVRNLKREEEAQAILFCETTKKEKKLEEDKVMIKEDKIY